MTEVRWIERREWLWLLNESRKLKHRISKARRAGRPTEALWRDLGRISAQIRDKNMKVRGIDDRNIL